jgi:exo-beta-1,3-glucanase (GH17 family)
MRIFLAAFIAFFLASPAWAEPVCVTREEAAPALSLLSDAMTGGRFAAYQPVELAVWEGNPVQASEISIREDLRTLRPWFDGLVTYGSHSGAELIPGIAKELGFRAVVMGIWNPDDDREVENALAAWKKHPDIVVGVSLGNEIVFGRRGTWEGYARAIGKFRDRAPSLPLTVTEPFATFLDDPEAKPVLAKLDFMAVNIHPVFEPWFKDAPPFNWADFVVQAGRRLAAEAFCGPILVKETGVPTAPAEEGFTPERQRDFYVELARQLPPSRHLAFAYFSAFDAPWRVYDESAVAGHHPEEAHWGLFTEKREPKPVMEVVPRLD